MFVDARTVPPDSIVEADICIVGAGAAGITIARELTGSGRRIALLESGGFEFSEATQDLYDGDIVGHSFRPLKADRVRFFGGSTNHWSGGCRPFAPIDFAERAYVPNSGWPFGREILDPYYRRAQTILQLGPFTYDPKDWQTDALRPVAFGPDADLKTAVFQYSPPTHFGEVYRQDLARGEGVTVYLNANLVDIETTDNASQVTGLKLATLQGGHFRARGQAYVLATGAIENARLLLNADKVQKGGLGNGFDLVGRYFMDHPYISDAATVLLAPGHPSLALYDGREIRGITVQAYFYAPAKVLERERLPGFCISIQPGNVPDRGYAKRSALTIYRNIVSGHIPDHLGFHLAQILRGGEWEVEAEYDKLTHKEPTIFSTNYISECPPDPESRVTLGDEVDALDLRRVRLDWRLPADLEENMHRAHELLAREMGRAGLGRLRLHSAETGRDPMAAIENGYHHMGTTRMHVEPKRGVVDENCRVHGIANLYIAGSSVFPTYSFDNPTMTIVALALRLAEHLKAPPPVAANRVGTP